MNINRVILTFLFGCFKVPYYVVFINGSFNQSLLSKNDQYFWLN